MSWSLVPATFVLGYAMVDFYVSADTSV